MCTLCALVLGEAFAEQVARLSLRHRVGERSAGLTLDAPKHLTTEARSPAWCATSHSHFSRCAWSRLGACGSSLSSVSSGSSCVPSCVGVSAGTVGPSLRLGTQRNCSVSAPPAHSSALPRNATRGSRSTVSEPSGLPRVSGCYASEPPSHPGPHRWASAPKSCVRSGATLPAALARRPSSS